MNYFYSIIGAFLMAFSVKNILEPMHLVTGGAAGIGILLKEVTAGYFPAGSLWREGIPLWISSILLNLPLFFVAYRKKGLRFVTNSLWGAVWFTVFLGVIPQGGRLVQDMLVNVILGGAIEGVGVGMVLRAKASTGGTDLFASFLHERLRTMSIPKIMAVTDGVIITAGVLLFGIEKGIYATIVIFVIAIVSERILNGFVSLKVAYIISRKAEPIAGEIMQQVRRGVTSMEVEGCYKGERKKMLMCVASKKQMIYVREIVMKHDKNAFFIVVDAYETRGEGFVPITEER